MNNRIKELAKQAGMESEDFPYDEFGMPWQQEEFAKLIVRECIQNIRDNMEHARVDTDGDRDLFLDTLRKSGHFYITELKEHFGVEECPREE